MPRLAQDTPQAPRLHLPTRPDLVYAIGDIHGCLDAVKHLEQRIIADAADHPGSKLIVTLGDYVDRGPQSAQTLDWLMQPPPPGFERVSLGGNHEAMFLAAFDHPEDCVNWLTWGGMQTLASYGIDPDMFQASPGEVRRQMFESAVPESHWTFLRTRPLCLHMPGFFLVHAGISPGVPLEQQQDQDLIWIREPFLSQHHGLDLVVVHGHTPSLQPVILPHRICVDTKAFSSGILTALRIPREGEPTIITA